MGGVCRMQLPGALAILLFGAPASLAQTLSLDQAVGMALGSNPAIQASQAGVRQASAGIKVARAQRLPHVSYDESYTRSNNPVFAFGSLLNQRRFTVDNFEIDRLNNPDSLSNFQSLLAVQQTVYDFGRAKHAVEAARIESQLSIQEQRARHADVILSVVRAYFGVVLARERLSVARQAVETAQSDVHKAQALAASGMATQADVLSVRVHLSGVEQERIKAEGDTQVATAALNQAMGSNQDRRFDLITPLTAPLGPVSSLDVYIRTALQTQPTSMRAQLAVDGARERLMGARRGVWPEVRARGLLEADRGNFASQAGGNWLAALSLHWDLWKGSEKRARIAAARHAHEKVEALGRQALSVVELQTRRAFFDLRSAMERVSVAAASVAQARESHRITQDRYQAGLQDVTELIRSQLALMQTQFRHLGTLYEHRVSRAVLEHAAGQLTVGSEALK